MDIVIRAAVVYLFVWLVLRGLGKRELGELTAFELVLLFIIGDLVQQSITQNDTSLSAAVIAISTIALLILVQSYVIFRWRRTRAVLEGVPVLVLADGRPLDAALHRERMTIEDVKESARQQGIGDLASIRFGIVEPGGKLSFVLDDNAGAPRAQNRLSG